MVFPIPVFWKPVVNDVNIFSPMPIIPYPEFAAYAVVIVFPIAIESFNPPATTL